MSDHDATAPEPAAAPAPATIASPAVPSSTDAATRPSAPAAEPPRKLFGVIGWVLSVVAVIALGAAGWYAWSAYDRVRSSEADLAQAATILEDAEDELLLVDEAVQIEISAVIATPTIEAVDLADDVRSDALEAAEIVERALGSLPEDRVAYAKALRDSADARAEMMELAPVILEADIRAATAIQYADQAVAEIKAAEDLSAQAVAEFNKHTADGVRASDAFSVQAEARLQVAHSLIASATASFPGTDFTAFSSYVDAKVSLIALAKEIDAVWLAGDIAGSNTKVDTYNQRDVEIVAMAQALPASVRDPIANAYNVETADVSTRYFDARERARKAGERVSELGEPAITDD